jgi:hypothetical protein
LVWHGRYLEMQIERETRLLEFARAMVRHAGDGGGDAAGPAPRECSGSGGSSSSPCAVLLCDRGTMDCKPFVAPAMWRRLLVSVGGGAGEGHDGVDAGDEARLCELRYDAVLHFGTICLLHRSVLDARSNTVQ